jgi:hypothetical protein
LASSVTATVLQQSVQLPHARPSTSAREDADADALECDAAWADEEIVILPSLALGFGDIKLTHYRWPAFCLAYDVAAAGCLAILLRLGPAPARPSADPSNQ